MYVDMRDGDENDNMDNWDDEKLKEVVNKKHGENDKKHPTTDIVNKIILIFKLKKKVLIYLYFRFANFSWKLLKKVNTDGSGLVPMELHVFIDMLYLLDLFLKRFCINKLQSYCIY